MNLPDYDFTMVSKLFKKSEISTSDIADKAYSLWKKQEYEDAAILFCEAARRMQQESLSKGSHHGEAMNYYIRAAFNFNQAGKYSIAEPMLYEALKYDWPSFLPNDVHMVEWAYSYLLYNAETKSKKEFEILFNEAIQHCNRVGRHFPSIHPQQEALLQIALNLDALECIRHIMNAIQSRKPISRAVKLLLKQAAEKSQLFS
ncbi:hypothetical protein EKN56_00575 [Limnobaculum zhutongyuii]|uniref:Tetratricopeptide repeat protein n=1 Tax=Limnobaculum zhutongyuii TaxID=2498113 RepID=A0A411WFP6_9GAMM|nr:hypothetical protein [Limnobaculum zhutongyuii]QBH95042.1 hypothetical protein EKN56_00575 [Limnobaculum zhutongyuii]TQS87618.1 hypothetical protein ELQ32_13345 [Limnobaculum zhutongyuii]